MPRYQHVRRPSHPFAARDGTIQKHRLVLMGKVGLGPQKCHWCGRDLEWIKGGQGGRAVVPDHVDGNGQNNDPANLVPSCVTCNLFRKRTGRRSIVKDDELFITRRGVRERAVEVPCRYCGQPFLTPAYRLAKGRGKFCSASHRTLHTNGRTTRSGQG